MTSDTSNTSNNHSSDKDRVTHVQEKKMLEPVSFVIDNSDKEESDKCQVSDKKKSRNNKTAKNMKRSYLFSRFVQEFIDNNKITIV